MNLTTKRMNLRRAFFSSAALVSVLGGMVLTGSNPVQAEQIGTQSIENPNQPDLTHMSKQDRRSAERALDRNNCALFGYGIKCAYGSAGKRHHILKAVRKGHAVAFRGDGRVLKSYINKVGIDKAVLELQRWDINYKTK